MHLKEACSLLVNTRKPLRPFVLNTVVLDHTQPSKSTQTTLKESRIIRRLKHEKDIFLAFEYFKSISNSQAFKHTPGTYKAMIERLGKEGELDHVQYILQQMKFEGINCTEDIFVIVIKSFQRAGFVEQALKTFYRMQDFGCSPTVKIYNHVLDALLTENRFGMINPIYTNMKRDGIKPNIFTYNILLKALCKNDRVDMSMKLLVEMEENGCSPDDVSYTTIVSALCQLGQLRKAEEVAKMFPPVVPAYNSVIKALCNESKFEEALLLLNEMEHMGISPNVITYTTIIDALCELGYIRLSIVLLAQMLIRGCSPNIFTFTSLIKGYFIKENSGEALEIWDLMHAMGHKPNIVAYNILIHGLCQNGNVDLALSLVSTWMKMAVFQILELMVLL